MSTRGIRFFICSCIVGSWLLLDIARGNPAVMFANRRTADIVIDGKLDEADWKNARKFSKFNYPGKAIEFSCQLIYDDDALYFALTTTMNNAAAILRKIPEAEEAQKKRYSALYSMELFLIPPDAAVYPYFQYVAAADGKRYTGSGYQTTARPWQGQWEAAWSSCQDTWTMEMKIGRTAMTPAAFEPLSRWRYNLVQNRHNVAVATIGDSAFFHNIDKFADFYIGSFEQYRSFAIANAGKKIKQWRESGSVEGERLATLEDYLRTLAARSEEQKSVFEEEFALVNYLNNAINSLELELKYTGLKI